MKTEQREYNEYRMKMGLFTMVLSLLVLILFGLFYSIGYQIAIKDTVNSVEQERDEIARRYLIHTFNPSTVEQQCAFEYTIYGECGED